MKSNPRKELTHVSNITMIINTILPHAFQFEYVFVIMFFHSPPSISKSFNIAAFAWFCGNQWDPFGFLCIACNGSLRFCIWVHAPKWLWIETIKLNTHMHNNRVQHMCMHMQIMKAKKKIKMQETIHMHTCMNQYMPGTSCLDKCVAYWFNVHMPMLVIKPEIKNQHCEKSIKN